MLKLFIFLSVSNSKKRSIAVVLLLNVNYSIGESCDELPTSLVYVDTSVNPHKILGHVEISEFREKKSIEIDYGKFYLDITYCS